MNKANLLFSGLILFAGACGGGGGSAQPPVTPPATTTAQNFAGQVTMGQKLYGEKCASCHGDSGEGKKAPAVVGIAKGALPLDPPATAKARKNQFKTVADIADFVTKTMPPDSPGSLSADEYWAILAFDLKANGIDLGEKKLDATLAPTLTVPR
jgi:S-disulfanyl-L-cysteine oxidoreductase SoxD